MSNGRTCSSCGQLVPEDAAECPRCASETQDVLPALPSISGYKIQGLIGRGGMGSVYLAEDQTLGRRTAVKLLSETLSQDEQAKTRFLREARAMATVEHPNIVRVYGFGEAEGKTYLVMEYVEGKTLAQRIQEAGRVPIDEALRILKQAVEGLESAWEKGIVHRDIKPANILMDAKGRVRVADFGLAKPVQVQGDSSLSHTGLVLGTPNYMSPEQIQGQQADFRSDIYSLGILLYEMLAGERPFSGTTPVEVMSHHLHTPLPDLRQKRADIPEGVGRLLEQMTQKDPAHRPSAYADVLNAIDALLPETTGAYESIQRHKRRLVVLAAAAVLILLASVSFLLFQLKFRKPQATALPQHRQVTFVGDASLPAISPDGKYVAYVSGGKLLVQEIAGGQPVKLFSVNSFWDLRWSPDGSQLAFSATTEEGWALFLIGRLGGTPRRIRIGPSPYISWSPDGSEIACGSDDEKGIGFVNVLTGVTRSISLKGSFAWLWDTDWSPSGSLLFLTQDEAADEFAIWTIRPNGTRQEKVVSDPNELTSARWSGAGDTLYYLRTESGTNNLLRLAVDPNSGKAAAPPSVLLTGLEAGSFFSLSIDGKQLSYTREPWHSNLRLAALEDLEKARHFQMKQLTTGTSKIYDARISPDGKQIAFSLEEAPKANIFTMPIQGGPFQQITFLNSNNRSPAWSPDGKHIAFGSIEGGRAKVQILNQDGSNLRAFQKSDLSKDSLSVSWAPDTNILYQRPGNRNFSVLNPETETERPLIQDDSVGWIFDPCHSPDGKQVAVDWNRKSGFGRRGLWIISMNDGSARFLKEGNIWPIGWSADAKWVYAYDEKGILKISVQTAQSERMPQIEDWEKVWQRWLTEYHLVDMSRDEKSFVLNLFEQQSDVWVVENFDPETAETREK